MDLSDLLVEVRSCTVCAADLPAGPRPIVQLGHSPSIVIIGQAPGRRVHESGKPWDDLSGDRLRSWLGLSTERFYDPDTVALVPMGLCYPGKAASGDKPPRPECAPLWHPRLLEHVAGDRLEIIIGTYAQRRYVPDRATNLTETVADWERYLPARVVLPHPSPRNAHWLTRNPWFESETLPSVRSRIEQVLRA